MKQTNSQRSDLAWEQVERGDPSGPTCFHVECHHCNHKFVANVTKVLNHLLGKPGVKKCTEVPVAVAKQLQALTAVKEASLSNKKREREEEDQQREEELQVGTVRLAANLCAVWFQVLTTHGHHTNSSSQNPAMLLSMRPLQVGYRPYL
jgi:hypothetical protein